MMPGSGTGRLGRVVALHRVLISWLKLPVWAYSILRRSPPPSVDLGPEAAPACCREAYMTSMLWLVLSLPPPPPPPPSLRQPAVRTATAPRVAPAEFSIWSHVHSFGHYLGREDGTGADTVRKGGRGGCPTPTPPATTPLRSAYPRAPPRHTAGVHADSRRRGGRSRPRRRGPRRPGSRCRLSRPSWAPGGR